MKKDRVGICALKAFRGDLLYMHISTEFPGVVKEIEELSLSTQKELELLGPSRQTSADQRRFLTRVAPTYQQEVARALNGNYDPELESKSPLKLRTHILKPNENFGLLMALRGHSKPFVTVEGALDPDYAKVIQGDIKNIKPGFLNLGILSWIREIYHESRGAQWHGAVNPVVLENLFRQLSTEWETFAKMYLKEAMEHVLAFNVAVFERLIPDEGMRQKLKSMLYKREQSAFNSASKELDVILKDERGGILQTANHYFADTLSAVREERVLARLKAAGCSNGFGLDIDKVLKSVHLSNEDQAVNDIHDILKAYYKVALKRFIDNVVLQVTERHLLGLGSPVKTLSPEMIGDLDDDMLAAVAGENFATSSARNELTSKYERLHRALNIAKQAGV
jgi:hypothetical protein